MPTWNVRFDLHMDADSPAVVQALARIDALAGVLRGLPVPPYLREQLDLLNIRRAVRGTTGIEGADVTEAEVANILAAAPDQRVLARGREREEQEVRNAARVMAYISDVLRQNPAKPMTEDSIAAIHRLTTENIAYDHNTPGVYRSHAVSAGSYVPPRTRDEVASLMRRLIEWLHSPATAALPPVVRAIAVHFYFISIHPFGDGNGRTARAIESYLLFQGRINVLGFYSLSNFYYAHRDEYVSHLDEVRFRSGNDLTPFVTFALDGLVTELAAVHAEVLQAMRTIAFRDYAHHELMLAGKRSTKAGERMYQLLAGIMDPVPIAAIRDGTHPLGRLYARLNPITLARDIAFLEQLRLVVVEDRHVRANLS